MTKNRLKLLRLWAIPIALTALLWVGCSKDYEREPEPEAIASLLADVPEPLQQAVTRRSTRSFLGTPMWEQHRLVPTGSGIPLLVLALPDAKLPGGWKAELVCALDTATYVLNVHVMVLPAESGGVSYTAYSFTPDGSWQYSLTVRNGRLRVTLPQQPTRYTDMTLGEPALQAHNSDEKVCAICGKRHADVNGGTLDESVVTAPKPQEYWDSILPDIIGGLWNMNPDHEFMPGGGTGSSDTPLPPPKTPCEQAKALAESSEFRSLMQQLKTKTSDNKEYAAYLGESSSGLEGGTVSFIAGQENEKFINLPLPSGKVDGLAHSHYGDGTLSIFSGGDIFALYQLLVNDKMNNSATFMLSVVTGAGTTYLLMIENEQQFRTFGSDTFDGVTTGIGADKVLEAIFSFMNIVEGGNSAQNEKGFLNFLRTSNAGLSLFKGDTDGFNAWNKIGLADNRTTTIDIPCP